MTTRQQKVVASLVSAMRESFEAGYYHAMSDMQVMNSNEQIQEACEAAFVRWGIDNDLKTKT